METKKVTKKENDIVEEEIVEGEFLEEENQELLVNPDTVSEIISMNIPLGSLSLPDPQSVITRAVELAKSLADIVNQLQLYVEFRNKKGIMVKYVYVEGWEVLGGMLGIGAHEVSSIQREDGAYIAEVKLIRHSDGAIVGRGSAICGMDEDWGGRKEYTRKSMATTRATGKAYRIAFSWIMRLAGYEPTPAEEMFDMIDEQKGKEIAGPTKKSNVEFDRENKPKDNPKSVLVRYGVTMGLDPKGKDIKAGLDTLKKNFEDLTWPQLVKMVDELAELKRTASEEA